MFGWLAVAAALIGLVLVDQPYYTHSTGTPSTGSTTTTQEYTTVITIDPSGGKDTPDCIQGKEACQSLRWAFQHRSSSTKYLLEKGTHFLNTSTETFGGNLNTLSFEGNANNSNEVVIHCLAENTGLAFEGVKGITLSHLTFYNCSALRNSTTRDYRNYTSSDDTLKFYDFQVGLYFYLCTDVNMLFVNVSDSPNATGVVMYDTNGTNAISDSFFQNNIITLPTTNTSSPNGGGGGFYVEFTYCRPGDADCNARESEATITGTSYKFVRSHFLNNQAHDSSSDKGTYLVEFQSDHVAFGRGGGLSIVVKYDSYSNSFEIENCTFENNKATWGGGMLFEFQDFAANNSVHINHSSFINNMAFYTLTSGTGGGGIRIGHYIYHQPQRDVPGNKILIENSFFNFNRALNGGGVSISVSRQNTTTDRLAQININDCVFYHNIARLGSGLHVDGFALILIGLVADVNLARCSFDANSVDYIEHLGLEEPVPFQAGLGAVYVHEVDMAFKDSMVFYYNEGTGLAAVHTRLNFGDCNAHFFHNSGNKGGGIALLGGSHLMINSNTRMNFTQNSAIVQGGAIYNTYISRENMDSYTHCFIRHIDPYKYPDDWGASFYFQDNIHMYGSHPNSIFSTSILPCAWAGGVGVNANLSEIFCWSNWSYFDGEKNAVDCADQLSTDTGKIISTTADHNNHVQAFPGHQFDLKIDITDDLGHDISEQTMFIAVTNTSDSFLASDGNLYSYVWGESANAIVWGESGSNINLQMDSIQNRVWHLQLNVELQPCPPGFILTNISPLGNNRVHTIDLNDTEVSQLHSCSCSGDYGRTVLCDNSYYSARLANGYWMGYIDPNNRTYVSGSCPAGFCYTSQKYSHFFLPNNSKDLDERICGSMNRTGILCGKCIDDYGPAVNSRNYECVNCTNPVGDTLKYVSAVYIPLLVMFLIIILFKVRLTIGAANAFILYAQVISSTFSIDAGGQTPLNLIAGKHTNSLLKAYRIPYGIFNLEFFENLVPPLCVGTELNALAVISLDYAVALAPLVMIVVVAIIFKISTCIGDRYCNTWFRQSRASSRTQNFIAKKKRSLSEAMLPAFSAFLLLSYTKFALTPSYILKQVILVDNNGNKIFPPIASYAGNLHINDRGYILHYVLPACIVLATFVVIPPLLLLDYPLRLFEWGLSKVEFLWRLYPVGKIHFILDTFQGCFKNKCRFFAGLYFVFRLVVNINFSFALTWLDQFMIQEIVCILMIMLVSIFQPYNEQNEIFNLIDVLIFTNFAVVNGLSFYLYEYSVNNPKADTLPASVFVIEYILVFLPLIYIIGYILWRKTRPCHKKLPCCKYHKRRSVNHDILEESCDSVPPNNARSLLDSNSYRDNRRFDESEELLFQRAKVVNLYKPPNHRVMVNESQEKKVVASTRQTNVSEDSRLRSLVSGSGINYGSTGSSTKESSGAIIHSTNSSV